IVASPRAGSPARAPPPTAHERDSARRRRPHRRRPRPPTRTRAMSTGAVVLIALVAALAGAALGAVAWRRRSGITTPPCERILLPFTGTGISRRVLDAALRLATAEHATLMPAYLARVPRHLDLDAPLPRQSGIAMPVLEAIEQAATREEVQ